MSATIVNLVHDEIVIEISEDWVDKARAAIEKDMVESGRTFLKSVPILVDIKISDVWEK
jgi:DNA polymerase-1